MLSWLLRKIGNICCCKPAPQTQIQLWFLIPHLSYGLNAVLAAILNICCFGGNFKYIKSVNNDCDFILFSLITHAQN